MDTIFSNLSIDRKDIKWEDHLYDLTPVEQVDGVYFKREDKFAPLGYGGINGSKLRQCIWLTSEYVLHHKNPVGVISGTSVKSPQLPMGSAVAEHFGLDSVHVIGATRAEIAMKHENVASATWFNAKFFVNKGIAYNPVLQRKCQEILERSPEARDFFYLEYGITLDHKAKWNTASRIEQFHHVGSEQVRNIPDHIETIIIPAGSCNSCTSILYGLAKYKPKNLRDVYLIGIGPNKIDFVEERLDIISKVSGIDTKPYTRMFHDSPAKQDKHESVFDMDDVKSNWNFNLHHYDLHTTKYVDYQDEMPYTHGDIQFHPTYEGKVMTYVKERYPHLLNNKTMVWVVGSKPYKEKMYEILNERLGEFPTELKEFHYAQ